MNNRILNLFFIFFLVSYKLQSQSITPYTFNNGGGRSINLEWSLCESVSISNFISQSYSLNTGILQPLTNIVTNVNEYGSSAFGNQINVSPNPTYNKLHIKARLNNIGYLSFQVIDSKSTVIFTETIGRVLNSYDKDIFMEKFPSGIYYIKVIFNPKLGTNITGIYKIIKL